MSAPVIGPETRVADLLDAHPEAEDVLIGIAPQFKALKNPLLRRTVAKVATLEQAARVAGMQPRELVLALRSELGLGGDSNIGDGLVDERGTEIPAWVSLDAEATIDGAALLDAGETPVKTVSATLAEKESGDVVVVTAPFQPAPLIDGLRSKGHDVFASAQADESWKVWIRKK